MAPPDFRGSLVVRGPMADDQYTRINNLALRGGIRTNYVGVFGFICSHKKGWTLTRETVAKELEIGVGFVDSALHEIERARCLIRERLRDEEGKLRGSVWFVTDLALQLRQLGIDDEELIESRVRAAFEGWKVEYLAALKALEDAAAADQDKAGSSVADGDGGPGEPGCENPTLDVTRENTGRMKGSRRSGPKSDFPSQAEPDQADPAHKKNNHQEDQEPKKTKKNGGHAAPRTPRRPPAPPSSGQGTVSRDSTSEDQQQPPQVVTVTHDRAREDEPPTLTVIDGNPEATASGDRALWPHPVDEPRETAADAAGDPDDPHGENEPQGGRQAAGRADLDDAPPTQDAPPVDGRAAARAAAQAARRKGRAIKGGRKPAPPAQDAPPFPDTGSVAT